MAILKDLEFTSHGLKCKVFLDGHYVENAIARFEKLLILRTTGRNWTINGIMRCNGKAWTQRPFQFREITTVEEDPSSASAEQQTTLVANIGNIVVRVFRVNNNPENTASAPTYNDMTILDEKAEFSEKMLKETTISHSIKLGITTPQIAPNLVSIKYIDGRNSPIATFTFKYRSLKALKDLLLIPRTPPPEPLEDRPVDSLSQEEMKILIERLKTRAIKEDKKVKRERTEDDEDIAEIVLSRPVKKTRVVDDEGVVVISDDEGD